MCVTKDTELNVMFFWKFFDFTVRYFNILVMSVGNIDFKTFDIIITMDASNEANLRRLALTDEDEAKIVPMAKFVDMTFRYDHIPDPYYEGAEGFELVLDLLQNGCANLYHQITNK